MVQDQLYVTFTLVRPDLDNDPARRANEIGIIVSNDLAKDDFEVSFQDNEYNLFASNALLVFLPIDDIESNLSQIDNNAELPGISDLMKIALLLKYGSWSDECKAMELARDHVNIQQFCLQTLENKLEIDRNRGLQY